MKIHLPLDQNSKAILNQLREQLGMGWSNFTKICQRNQKGLEPNERFYIYTYRKIYVKMCE